MITNRELTVDDYFGMLRRRIWVILIPALIAPAIGFGVSFLMTPKYTSSASVLVEGQKVPEGFVKPIVSEDLMQRITALEQQVLSRNRLQPMIERLGLAKGAQVDDTMDEIRAAIEIQPMEPATNPKAQRRPGQEIPGFVINYTASRPREAQQICSELTSMLLEENLKTREQVAQGTTDFLSRQLDEAKRSLDEQDSKLAAFKRQYVGQLPGDSDNNLKILMGLNSQLDANTQTINRAQQDKAYAESVLAQQVAAYQASGNTSSSPQALEQQLAQLQSQLVQLQGRYTPDHPDVIKTKADIAQVTKQLNLASSAKPEPGTEKPLGAEPPEVKQLRVQIHQYQDTITQATQDQKKLQEQIRVYQGRVALSPAVEEQYKLLTRDYDSAQKFYDDLLAKKSQSEMATDMERQQQGEQFQLLNPATSPNAPSFPNRLLFAGGGFGAGMVLGLGLAFLLEFRDKSIRNELDVEAVMELPVLVALPWVGDSTNSNGSSASINREPESRKETVEV